MSSIFDREAVPIKSQQCGHLIIQHDNSQLGNWESYKIPLPTTDEELHNIGNHGDHGRGLKRGGEAGRGVEKNV